MVFNLVGYKVILGYLQQHASDRMVEKIDSQVYDKASLTEVKIPLHLPYPVNEKEFQRYDGSIEINGITYNFVERKQQNDTLILHCITNTAANRIKKAGNDYTKSINDFQPGQKGQKESSSALFLKVLECADYKLLNYNTFNNLFFSVQSASYKNTSEIIVDDNFSQSPEQPPDLA